MSGDLVISGGGSTEVATETLLAQRQHLGRLADEMEACLARLRFIDGAVTRARLRAVGAPHGALRAETAMAQAHDTLRSVKDRAGHIVEGLDRAIKGYSDADAYANQQARRVSALLAHEFGSWLPLVAVAGIPLLLPGALTAGGAFAGVWAFTPEEARKKAIGAWVRDNKGLLSDPRFVSTLRLAVSSADDLGEGLVHLPEPLGQLLGDDGLGILGVGSSAAVVIGVAGAVGTLRETPVSTTLASTRTGVSPPAGIEARAQRIPTGANQICIDRYPQPDAPDRFEVYLGGTIDGSLTATTEPWDMTSNLNGVAGGVAGSLVATRQAMALAGVDSTTPVTFTGYSQGGLVAAELAASGDYDTRGLVTFGGPAGQVSVPHDIPYLALEHADDLVPATGGVWKSSDPLLVTRTVYADQPYTGELVVPAHELSSYRETASLADASDEQRLVALRDALGGFSEQVTLVQSSYYRAVRTGP